MGIGVSSMRSFPQDGATGRGVVAPANVRWFVGWGVLELCECTRCLLVWAGEECSLRAGHLFLRCSVACPGKGAKDDFL